MAVIESQTLRVEDADVQLLAGAVGRAEQPPAPYPGMLRTQAEAMESGVADGRGRRTARRRVPPLLAPRQDDASSRPHVIDRALRAGGRAVRAELRGARGRCPTGASSRNRATRTRSPSRWSTPSSDPARPISATGRCPVASPGCSRPTAPAAFSSWARRRSDHTAGGRRPAALRGHRFRSHRSPGPDLLRHPARQHQAEPGAPSPRRLPRHRRQRHRQRGHRGRDGGAGRRVERDVELGAGGEALVHPHPLPGPGPGAGHDAG